jgi:hypothetical protein
VVFPYYKQNEIRLSSTTVQYIDSIVKSIKFVHLHPHTTSRADYVPAFFIAKKERARKIYSSPLHLAWNDVTHTFPDRSDWFLDTDIYKEWFTLPVIKKVDITSDYFNALPSLLMIKDEQSPFLPS